MMKQQMEFLKLMVESTEKLNLLQYEVARMQDSIAKDKKMYQRNTKGVDFNGLLKEYLLTPPDWLVDKYGNTQIEIKSDRIILTLKKEYVDCDWIKTEFEYKDPYYIGDFLSNNFAGRSKFWESKPYRSKKYKLDKYQSYNVYQKIKIQL